ncbi:four helix bundle protein [Acetivibrio mesophilus]|nr:four helix bundle protein [Acetivibrio mesophilus]
MYDTIRDFRSLIVYQKAKEMANDICELSKKFPPSERYESTSQIRRAATSVVANIAEGNGQLYPTKELTFINTAIGSLAETRYWLEFAHDQDFIQKAEYERIDAQCIEITKMLYGYMRRVKKIIEIAV